MLIPHPVYTLLSLATLLSGVLGAQEIVYKLHHRVFHPSFPDAQYAPRGQLRLVPGSHPALVDAPELRSDLSAFSEAIRGALKQDEDAFEVLYQVALERPGDSSPREYDVSSVRACHLDNARSASITLHASPMNGLPHALDFFLSPTPEDGSCPTAFAAGQGSKLAKTFNIREIGNTTVSVQIPISPPSPKLKEPPPLTPQGEVVTPEPEKSFIQKYWIYIAGVLIAITLAPGGEEPAAGGQGGGGGAPAR